MFESITIRQQNHTASDNPIDLGFLAEAMLFYNKVMVIADPGILRQLAFTLGPDLLLEYLNEGFLEITYVENGIGVHTRDAGKITERHEVCLYKLPSLEIQQYSAKIFEEITDKRGRGRRLADKLMRIINVDSYKELITEQARQDIKDPDYVIPAVRFIISSYAPEYKIPDPLIFNIENRDSALVVDTSIDFRSANSSYHRYIPSNDSSLSPAYIISFLTNTRSHLYFASNSLTELALEQVNSSLLKIKMASILEKRNQSETEMSVFQDYVFNDARAIRKAINSGTRDFNDLIDVIRKARRFKEWLSKQPMNQDLVKSCFQEISRDSWIDRLPAKLVRWSIFTLPGVGLDVMGAGEIGIPTGLALSAADAFIVDKIAKGWNPSNFINEDLKNFTGK